MTNKLYKVIAERYDKNGKLIDTVECVNSGVNEENAVYKAEYLNRGKNQEFKVLSVNTTKLEKGFECYVCGGPPDYALDIGSPHDVAPTYRNYCMNCEHIKPKCKRIHIECMETLLFILMVFVLFIICLIFSWIYTG